LKKDARGNLTGKEQIAIDGDISFIQAETK